MVLESELSKLAVDLLADYHKSREGMLKMAPSRGRQSFERSLACRLLSSFSIFHLSLSRGPRRRVKLDYCFFNTVPAILSTVDRG